jgi:hypothetical protein
MKPASFQEMKIRLKDEGHWILQKQVVEGKVNCKRYIITYVGHYSITQTWQLACK